MIEERRLIDARPFELLQLVLRNGSHRKCRLLLGECCRRLGQDEIGNLCERDADGAGAAEQLQVMRHRPWLIRFLVEPRRYRPTRVPPSDKVREFIWQGLAQDARSAVTEIMDLGPPLLQDEWPQLIHDIFGNAAGHTLDPRWLSSTVVDLARTIYDERVFERMPILADALMDAGCDSEEIINHCQGPGPHTRGCWVVDLLLGKN